MAADIGMELLQLLGSAMSLALLVLLDLRHLVSDDDTDGPGDKERYDDCKKKFHCGLPG